VDSFVIAGQSQLLTRPFSASGRLAQIELKIRETARPLPRRLPFWNAWVPSDARRLNVGVFHASLVPVGSEETVPSFYDFRSENRLRTARFNGVYSDSWIGPSADFALTVPPKAHCLQMSGMIPQGAGFSFPYPVRVYIDGDYLGEDSISGAGRFKVHVPLGRTATNINQRSREVTVSVKPASCFVGASLGISPDKRCLAFVLDRIAFE
jgi:hypothetical protein